MALCAQNDPAETLHQFLSVFFTCLCALASAACCEKKDIAINMYRALIFSVASMLSEGARA